MVSNITARWSLPCGGNPCGPAVNLLTPEVRFRQCLLVTSRSLLNKNVTFYFHFFLNIIQPDDVFNRSDAVGYWIMRFWVTAARTRIPPLFPTLPPNVKIFHLKGRSQRSKANIRPDLRQGTMKSLNKTAYFAVAADAPIILTVTGRGSLNLLRSDRLRMSTLQHRDIIKSVLFSLSTLHF